MDNNSLQYRTASFIDGLSIDELISINRIIIERIKHLQKTRSLNEMNKFKLGENVSFYARDGRLISGRIIKFNVKTLTILTDENIQWNVSPVFLMRKI